ncbi:MAG: hypothetical protein WAW15_00445 [Minisyncoccales bacterium]
MGDSNSNRFVCLRFSYVSILTKEIRLSRIDKIIWFDNIESATLTYSDVAQICAFSGMTPLIEGTMYNTPK